MTTIVRLEKVLERLQKRPSLITDAVNVLDETARYGILELIRSSICALHKVTSIVHWETQVDNKARIQVVEHALDRVRQKRSARGSEIVVSRKSSYKAPDYCRLVARTEDDG